MRTQNIVATIYKYYPKNLDWNDIETVTDSLEYKNRQRKCFEAATNNSGWINFKKELTTYNTSKNGSRVYDYSMLGNVPCYHGSITFGLSESYILSVFISVIMPLWAYRIMDAEGLIPTRYKYIDEEEEIIVNELKSLIDKNFPGYSFIGEDQHQIVIPDVATAFNSSPSIFEAIFTENEN